MVKRDFILSVVVSIFFLTGIQCVAMDEDQRNIKPSIAFTLGALKLGGFSSTMVQEMAGIVFNNVVIQQPTVRGPEYFRPGTPCRTSLVWGHEDRPGTPSRGTAR